MKSEEEIKAKLDEADRELLQLAEIETDQLNDSKLELRVISNRLLLKGIIQTLIWVLGE